VKVFGFLLVGAAFGVLFLFVWPLLKPVEPAPGAPPPKVATLERVQATGPTGTGEAPAPEKGSLAEVAREAATAEGAAPSGPLCDRQWSESNARVMPWPKGEKVRSGPQLGGKPWTWLNVWAAWCKPCKAEMPEIAAWASKVREGGGLLRVLFLSVDDDERQLRMFLAGEGAAIAGDYLWVQEEAERASFYGSIGVGNPPTLPVQALLDPQGAPALRPGREHHREGTGRGVEDVRVRPLTPTRLPRCAPASPGSRSRRSSGPSRAGTR
jgi:thiol-disulfide isomerase/thioredoxin